MKPGRNLEFDPTFTVSREDERPDFPDDPLVDGPVKGEPGLSLRWGVTPNLALNGALSPDFSQVEADAAQLSINRRFTLFYPEKRPFFLEGADFFSTPFRAVHTRTVADPDWGVKLTGKEGRSAPAVFFTRDEVTNLLFPGREESSTASLDQPNTNGVLRFRRDLGDGSAIGILATGRQGDDYHNWVGGLDIPAVPQQDFTRRWLTVRRRMPASALRPGYNEITVTTVRLSPDLQHEEFTWDDFQIRNLRLVAESRR